MSNRREFLKQIGASAVGFAMSGLGGVMASPLTSKEWSDVKRDKVRIAYIGIGNRGEQNIHEFAATGMVDVTVLCDIDMGAPHTQKALSMYKSEAKRS